MISGIEKIKARFECEIEDNLVSRVYTYVNTDTSIFNPLEYKDKEDEAVILENYIEENNLWYNDLQFGIFLDEGAEQKIFFNDEESKVIKLNDVIFYVNWSQYFESLLIHNILFTQTKYTLLGFIKINKILYSVVSQDYIKPTEKTNIDQVKKYMQSKGFTIKKKNDYVHTELGLIIEDLHEENVLVKDNTLFFIDTVIYLK